MLEMRVCSEVPASIHYGFQLWTSYGTWHRPDCAASSSGHPHGHRCCRLISAVRCVASVNTRRSYLPASVLTVFPSALRQHLLKMRRLPDADSLMGENSAMDRTAT